MGSFLIRPQNCGFWLAFAFRCVSQLGVMCLLIFSFSAFPHYGPCNISSPLRKHGFLRGGCLIQYLFDQLPTLYFAVLMLSHLLDHFIFSSRRFSTKSKAISFGVLSFTIISIWWWFKGVSFGITGPVNDNKRLQWRKVSNVFATY